MKLSIIIPVYNTSSYLPACLDSVIRPGIGDYEIIVVNDGSTDDSQAVIDSYLERFPGLIRSVTTANGGLGAARNVGLEMAQGEYLMFLDSDDRLSEDAVQEMLEATESGHDIYIFDILSVNESGDVVSTMPGCGRQGEVSLSSYPQLLTELPSACNKLFRRTLFTDTGIRFPSPVWYEDLRTVPKLYLHTDKVLYISRPWYLYLLRQGSITNSAKLMRNLEIIDAVDDTVGHFRLVGKYDEYKQELDYLVFYNMFLTASVRVASADPRCPALETLHQALLERVPDYRENRYFRSLPKKHAVLSRLLLLRMRRTVALLMRLNNLVKNKKL